MNDPKLKLAMAKLLPEKIAHELSGNERKFYWLTHWNATQERDQVLETEWLYVMQLVEETLTEAQKLQYAEVIYDLSVEDSLLDYSNCYYEGDGPDLHLDKLFVLIAAPFNQRATAMCKVKNAAVAEPPTTAANPTQQEKESR